MSEHSIPSLEALLGRSTDGFALLDGSGAVLHVNPAGLSLLGLERPGEGAFPEWIDERDREALKTAFASILCGGAGEAKVRFRSSRASGDFPSAPASASGGTARVLESHIGRDRDAAGKENLILNFRACEEPIGGSRGGRSSEARLFEMLLGSLPVMACRIDRRGIFVESRGLALRAAGLADGEAIGTNALESWPDCRYFLEKALRGEPAHFERETGQGEVRRIYEVWLLPDPAEGGVVGFGVDVTDRRRAEDELSKSEAFNRRIIESSRDCIMVLDAGALLQSISYSGRKLLEMEEPENFLNRSWLDFWRGEDRTKAECALRAATRTGVGKFQGYCPTVTGRPKWWDVILTPILNPSWEPERLLAVCRDITEHKRFEESLRRSKEQSEAILGAISDSVVVADPVGRVVFANEAALRLFGLDGAGNLADISLADLAAGSIALDERGMPIRWPSLPQAGEEDGSEARAAAAAPLRVLHFRGKPGGIERWLVVNSATVRDSEGRVSLVIATAYDFTERKRAEDALRHSEEQLRQSQKMEAVGRLAGGVAHDFNNLLTAINGYGELLMRSLRETDPLQSTVAEIRRAGERAASLTRQLLTFSRRQVMASRVLDLNQVVGEIRQMLGRLIGEDIHLITVGDSGLAKINTDPGQMEQVILNLALNARDAMPTGGTLTIETCNASLDPSQAGTYFATDPGSYVRLTITDTGIGMSEEVKAHLFEPFFTTKPPGQGTGLGLSTVYGILKAAGGNIAVASEPGRGTSFSVYLPVAEAAKDEEARVRTPEKAPRSGGRETVLLVEDEDMVRRLIGQVLLSHGYNILEAGSGQAALEVVGRYSGTIDLLLTDVVMAGMSGRELAEKLVATIPGLKVLYMSGYTDDATLRHGVFQNSTAFLGKPFSPVVLARKIREILDGVDSVQHTAAIAPS